MDEYFTNIVHGLEICMHILTLPYVWLLAVLSEFLQPFGIMALAFYVELVQLHNVTKPVW